MEAKILWVSKSILTVGMLKWKAFITSGNKQQPIRESCMKCLESNFPKARAMMRVLFWKAGMTNHLCAGILKRNNILKKPIFPGRAVKHTIRKPICVKNYILKEMNNVPGRQKQISGFKTGHRSGFWQISKNLAGTATSWCNWKYGS